MSRTSASAALNSKPNTRLNSNSSAPELPHCGFANKGLSISRPTALRYQPRNPGRLANVNSRPHHHTSTRPPFASEPKQKACNVILMKRVNIFGVATPYAEELIETCFRLGIDFQSINNLAESNIQVQHVVEKLDAKFGPCVVAPSAPIARADATRNAFKLGVEVFTNLVDPSSRVASTVQLGCGNYVNAMSVIGSSSRIGCHCNINRAASIGHHNKIESYASIGPGATLSGSVLIGFGTLIGAGAVILPEVRVGSNAIVGAGAVVTKHVPDDTIVLGNPARPVGKNADWASLRKCPVC